jgi:hypothetical protein
VTDMHDEKLRAFLLTPKPEWCKFQDVAVMAYLMVIADQYGYAAPLQLEIAQCTASGAENMKGLRSSLARLHEHNWITWHKTSLGQRHRYLINFGNLPKGETHG